MKGPLSPTIAGVEAEDMDERASTLGNTAGNEEALFIDLPNHGFIRGTAPRARRGY